MLRDRQVRWDRWYQASGGYDSRLRAHLVHLLNWVTSEKWEQKEKEQEEEKKEEEKGKEDEEGE